MDIIIKDVVTKSREDLRKRELFDIYRNDSRNPMIIEHTQKKTQKYTSAIDYYNDVFYDDYFFGLIKIYRSFNTGQSVPKNSIPISILHLIRDRKTFWTDQMLGCFSAD